MAELHQFRTGRTEDGRHTGGIGKKVSEIKKLIGNIPLALGKELKAVYSFVETADAKASEQEITDRINELKNAGAEVIVATEAYSVDDPANESFVVNLARSMGLYATGGYEVSKLYGLKVRTRTAVVNGSLIPRMMERLFCWRQDNNRVMSMT